jgi:hypothetical protein
VHSTHVMHWRGVLELLSVMKRERMPPRECCPSPLEPPTNLPPPTHTHNKQAASAEQARLAVSHEGLSGRIAALQSELTALVSEEQELLNTQLQGAPGELAFAGGALNLCHTS